MGVGARTGLGRQRLGGLVDPFRSRPPVFRRSAIFGGRLPLLPSTMTPARLADRSLP